MMTIKERKERILFSQVQLRKSAYSVRQRYLTLVEVLIVFCIIICGAALTAVKWKSLVEETQFESEVSLLQGQFQLAQDFMLISNADVLLSLTVNPETKQLQSRLTIEKPINPKWGKSIEKPISYPSILASLWNEVKIDHHLFYFTPSLLPKGELCLYSKPSSEKEKKVLQKKIHLSGTLHTGNKTLGSKAFEDPATLYPLDTHVKVEEGVVE